MCSVGVQTLRDYPAQQDQMGKTGDDEFTAATYLCGGLMPMQRLRKSKCSKNPFYDKCGVRLKPEPMGKYINLQPCLAGRCLFMGNPARDASLSQ